jgi:hypothetical protein
MSVDPTGAITWDTGNFPEAITSPFAVASYTLIVHDAASDITDVPSAGYLGAYDQYVFGMYTGYVSWTFKRNSGELTWSQASIHPPE